MKLEVGKTYVDRAGRKHTLEKNVHKFSATHTFRSGGYSFDENGRVGIGDYECEFDLVSEFTPPFSISPGNYYRTRDGRKAYVACGPATVDYSGKKEDSLFGIIYEDDPDPNYNEYSHVAQDWQQSGRLSEEEGDDDDDLVAPWHPETLTDPTTGKKYRVAEEVT